MAQDKNHNSPSNELFGNLDSFFPTSQNIIGDLAGYIKESPAKSTYNRLMNYINEFEQDLDNEHEVGAYLVSFGSIVFHIDGIGYYGPDIITFYGINDQNEKVQLVQNASQLNVLLVALKKLGSEPKRIGFPIGKEETEKE